MRKTLALVILLLISVYSSSFSFANSIVITWNNVQLEAIKHETVFGPTIASRALAIVNTCMYDAWVPFDPKAIATRPNGIPKTSGSETDKEKAISFAAYNCLLDLYPEQKTLFDNTMTQLNYDLNDQSAPANIGRTAANNIIVFRHQDGANQLGDLHPGAYSDYTNYQPVNTPTQLNDPNRWQPVTFLNGDTPSFITPHWGRVAPFSLTTHDQFLPTPPNLYPHGVYTQQANELIKLSANLTDKEKK